ncbi:hypothetical protein E2C01_060334 [Portunus trituberculatus]|uniref:Uncharacterized protein n=1 Tax=Portunus trituberculatus TaxID=210409 RepID=A0A5B7HB42_PORTR|nr:hypothetical protein [Portunus trituberculatus]
MFATGAEHRGVEGRVKGSRRRPGAPGKARVVWLLPLHDNFCFPLHPCGPPCCLLAWVVHVHLLTMESCRRQCAAQSGTRAWVRN